jgi:hypothetical protein
LVQGWADAPDLLPQVGLEVGERVERQVDVGAGLLDQVPMHVVVLEREQPAAGVLDDDDLLGAEQVLTDDQGADRVVGREAAGVADDVGVARPEPERVLDREPGVHAGQDGELPARRQRQRGVVELGGVALVLGEHASELGGRRLGCHEDPPSIG